MADVIYVIMRWMHIASVAVLIGGMIFGVAVLSQAAEGLAPDAREKFLDKAALLFRPLGLTAMACLLISAIPRSTTCCSASSSCWRCTCSR
jgi:uncharacterized membrane protein